MINTIREINILNNKKRKAKCLHKREISRRRAKNIRTRLNSNIIRSQRKQRKFCKHP